MFFKKDIYKALRPTPDNSFLGMAFKKMSDVNYKDALIYPRFKFFDADKPHRENGIFETSDYKKILEIIGNRTLSVGSIFGYNKINYEITSISVDILDIVIDYSNGHTDYYVGKAIPFHVEISVLVKKRDYWDITLEFAKKYSELKNKENLSVSEKLELITNKNEAERCFENILSHIKNDAIQGKVAVDIYRAYGIFKSDCKQHLEAIALFSQAIEIDPLNSELHFYIGYEYGLIPNDEMGLKYLKKAADLGSKEASDYIDENYR
ncbi:MAG: hypothetical protein KGZ58_09485 [Ignavibacteriales bacterium]|nr:hypothetical protein [Ignavibacteriales bacterium]